MNFALSEDQQLLRETLREFVDNEIVPHAAKWDAASSFPQDIIDQCAEMGLAGIVTAKEFGGAGLTTLDYAIAIEEISRGCASTGVILSVNNSLAIFPIEHYGSAELKKKYLPDLATGKKIGCFGLTEPAAGSDAAGQTTTYREEGDAYILNGSKNFITNGPEADLCIVFASRDTNLGNKAVSAFVVERDFKGYSVGKVEKKMGICASGTSSVVLENVAVPKMNLIGSVDDGFKIAMSTLDGGRIGIAAQAVGIAQAAFESAVKYAEQRQQFGKPIANFQGLRWMMTDMATSIEASRLLTWKAALAKDRGGRYSLESAQAKLFASETASRVTSKAVQIHGGYGYIKEYPVERFMRDARITEIYEGTSEIQRLVIASTILKNMDAVAKN